MKENLVKVGQGHTGHLNDGKGRTVCGREVSGKITAKDRRTGEYPLCRRCAQRAPLRAADVAVTAPTVEDVLKDGDELDKRWGVSYLGRDGGKNAHSEREPGRAWCGLQTGRFLESAAGRTRCATCVEAITLDARWGKNVFAEKDITNVHSEREHGATWCGKRIDYPYTERTHVERPRWVAGLQRCAACVQAIQKPAASEKLDDVLDTRAVWEVVNPDFRKLPEWLMAEHGGGAKHHREGPDSLVSDCGRLLTTNTRWVTTAPPCGRCVKIDATRVKRGEPWGGGEMVIREYTPGEIREEMRRSLLTMGEFARERGLVWGNGEPVVFSLAEGDRENRDTLHVQPERDSGGELALCGVETWGILNGRDLMGKHRVEESAVCEACRVEHGYKVIAVSKRDGDEDEDRLGRALGKAIAGIEAQDESCLVWAHCLDCKNKPGPCACSGDAMARQEIVDAALSRKREGERYVELAKDMARDREAKVKVEKSGVYSDVPARGVREALEQLLEVYQDYYGPGGAGAPGSMQRAYHCIQVDLGALLEKYPAGE